MPGTCGTHANSSPENIDSDQDLLSLKIQMYERNLNVDKRIEKIISGDEFEPS